MGILVTALFGLFSIVASGLALLVPWLIIVLAPIALLAMAPLAAIVAITRRSERIIQLAPPRRPRVLIVDDEPWSIAPLVLALSRFNVEIQFVTDTANMMRELKARAFDLILLDRFLTDMKGEEVLRLGDLDPDVRHDQKVVFYTANPDNFTIPSYAKFSIQEVWSKRTPLLEITDRMGRLVSGLAVA